MVRSMTAFSRSSLSADAGLLTLEIQSLNRRHLEVHTNLPREFIEFDALIKKEVQKRLNRGKVQVFLSFLPHAESEGIEKQPNLSLAKEIKKGWDQIADHLEIQKKEEGLLQLLTQENHLFIPKVTEAFTQQMEEALNKLLTEGLDKLIGMRETEGEHLKGALKKQLAEIQERLKRVESLEEKSKEDRHLGLKKRLEKLLDDKMQDDERFHKEVAYLVERSDITEEIARLHSHLSQFDQTLAHANSEHGKMLDFITQEMTREWNTIGAKCSDHDISKIALGAKSACEKIREQIHNIE